MSSTHNYIRNTVQNYNFDPTVFYAQNPYAAEDGATIGYGMTAVDGNCELIVPSLANLKDYSSGGD